MANRNDWIAGRVTVLEGQIGRGRERARSKAERDAAAALDLADPRNEAAILAQIPEHDERSRAAVRAAFRADS